MRSKEEILTQKYLGQVGCLHNAYVKEAFISGIKDGDRNYALEAMSEYAKEVALAFYENIEGIAPEHMADEYDYFIKTLKP